MLCEIAPPSDQLLKTYCTPDAPDCGELVAMVCDEPGIQFSTSGAAASVPPSTETSRPAGLVVIVVCTAAGAMFTHHPLVSAVALFAPLAIENSSHVPLGAVLPNCEVNVAAPSVAAYSDELVVGAGAGNTSVVEPVSDLGLYAPP